VDKHDAKWVDVGWLEEFANEVEQYKHTLETTNSLSLLELDAAAARTLEYFAEPGSEKQRPLWRGYFNNFLRDELRQRLI